MPQGYFPESIAMARDGTLYVGSAVEGSIVRIRPGSAAAEAWVPPGANGLMSVQGLYADDRAGLLYACTGDLSVAQTPKVDNALLAFDLRTGAAKGRWVLPGGGFCNDIVAAPEGRLLISDTAKPRILRFDPRAGQLTPWIEHPLLGGSDFNGNGIAVDGSAVYLNTFSDGRLLRIPVRADGSAGTPEQVAMPRALAGADALRVIAPGRMLVFENDITGGNGRVTRIDLTAAEPVLTTIAEQLREPTSGIVRGDDVLVLESQFRKLFGPDKGQAPVPFVLRSVSLKPALVGTSERIPLPFGLDFPNGIASTADGTLFVGGIASGRIWRRDALGNWSVFHLGSDDQFAVTSLRLDEKRHVLWGASPDAAATLSGAGQARQHRIFALDAQSGMLLGKWPMPDGGFGNDIALDGRGGVYVSDSLKAVVRHLAADRVTWSVAAQVPVLAGGGLGPAGLVVLPTGELIVGLFSEGKLMRVRKPGPQATAEPLTLARPLVRPDGMALASDGRIVLVVGGSGEVLSLDAESGDLKSLAAGLRTPVNVDVRKGGACVTELGVDRLADLDTRKPRQARPGVYCLNLEKAP